MNSKTFSIFTTLLLIGVIVFFYFTCISIPVKTKALAPNHQQKHVNAEKFQIVQHRYYTLAYSEANEQPAWVCYTLKKEHVGGKKRRPNNFIPDPLVSSQTANDSDYKNTGYDKGHMVPAADMSWSSLAMKETFYYSNVSPQVPAFNRGVWKKLEEKVRRWAVEFDSVKIYTGPVFKDNIKRIGPDSVTVPGHYFKVVLEYHNSKYEGVGFIFPNKKINKSISDYAVSIDSVERYTNLDFYSYLPDNIEENVEFNINLSTWGLSMSK